LIDSFAALCLNLIYSSYTLFITGKILMIHLISRLKNDHEHGSKEMAMRLLRDYKNFCTTHIVKAESFSDFLNQVDAARPSMTLLQNITQSLRGMISDNVDSIGNVEDAIINGINQLLKEMELSDQRIYEKTKTFCQTHNVRSVLTHSRSATIEYVLRRLGKSGTLTALTCTESRPLYEGVALANSLSADLNTTIIVDTLADSALKQCDCLMLGADAIDKHGNILNKIGSRLMALSAKDHNIPVICLAEAMKILPEGKVASLSGEHHSATELGHMLNHNISVTNQYFEVVENELLTRIISDQETSDINL
jgi:translation initiation factor 2B subunit (eIF-2B alpha/beta/delta family)